jgi:hypothetical protein
MRIERGFAAWIDFLVLVKGFMYGLKPVPFKSSTDSRGRSCLGSDEPGLKALFLAFIQGAEAPCSLR